tara:strand:+ start:20631 stop:21356 length:726 start_codon:yes stop_codon:yes gene_type:complete
VKRLLRKDLSKTIFLVFFFLITNSISLRLFKFIDKTNIFIVGSNFISTQDLIDNSSIKLPLRLINLQEKLIEKELKENLSLKDISVKKQLFPIGLKVIIREREPIAYAEKSHRGEVIEGFIDKNGFFIESKFRENEDLKLLPVKIIGWDIKHTKTIAKILEAYTNNIHELNTIQITSEGFIFLEEEFFKNILLGFQPEKIDLQLDLIFEIKNQINKQKITKKIENLDLTEPMNPRLKVFIP